MPINKREPPSAKWTHHVKSNYFEANFAIKSERVVRADPVLHWTLGHRFDKVREQCSQLGWSLIDLRIKQKGNP